MLSFLIKHSIGKKGPKQFTVAAFGDNYEPLYISERLTSWANAKKNIMAVIKGAKPQPGSIFKVEDATKQEVFMIEAAGKAAWVLSTIPFNSRQKAKHKA